MVLLTVTIVGIKGGRNEILKNRIGSINESTPRIASNIGVYTGTNGQMAATITDASGNVWYKLRLSPNKRWLDWRLIGKPNTTKLINRPMIGLAATGDGSGFIPKFTAIGADGNLWIYNWKNNQIWSSLGRPISWRSFGRLGNKISDTIDPLITSTEDGRLVIFVLFEYKLFSENYTRYEFWQKYQIQGRSDFYWSAWYQMPGRLNFHRPVHDVDVVKTDRGIIEFFSVDSFGDVFHTSQVSQNSPTFLNWRHLNAPPRIDFIFISACSQLDGRLILFGDEEYSNYPWYRQIR